jgi:hypothetical protein
MIDEWKAPIPRDNVRLSNLQVLNASLYVAEHGCKRRDFPPWATGTLSAPA